MNELKSELDKSKSVPSRLRKHMIIKPSSGMEKRGVKKLKKNILSENYIRYQKIESYINNKRKLGIGNNGERLIPGYSNNIDEIIRHRSTYAFFKKIIENDIIKNPEIIKKGVSILDLGSGVGHGTIILAEIQNSKVVGLEVNSDAVSYAKNNYCAINTNYINNSIENYLKGSDSFDYIVSRHVVEHIEMAINEILSKLKFKYRAMISVPYKEIEGNIYHKHTMISENSFSAFQNKEFFYEDLRGYTDSKPFINKTTNSFTCVLSGNDVLPVRDLIKFPVNPVGIFGLEKDFLELIDEI